MFWLGLVTGVIVTGVFGVFWFTWYFKDTFR